jgi:peptidoglycan/xylan/chitin deacetylase (PgdA/CDA1 family)
MKKIKESILALRIPNITYNTKGNLSKRNYITPTMFEKYIMWLFDWKYNPLTPQELQDFLFSDLSIPHKSYLLMFEGGYKSIYKYAYPVLKRYRIPSLVFLVTNCIGDYNRWENSEDPILSIEEINELNKTTMFTFGLQSKTGRPLTKVSDSVLEDEIIKSSAILEEILRYKAKYFLYPNDKYDSKVIEKLLDAEIPLAFINKHSQVTGLNSFHKIPSIKLTENDGYLGLLRKIRKVEI